MSHRLEDTKRSAREEVLARIRAALPGEIDSVEGSHAAIVRNYCRAGQLPRSELIALFIDRLLEYDTEVLELNSKDQIAAAIATVLKRAGEELVLVAEEFPQAWIAAEVAVTIDHRLSTESIDRMQAVVTTCEAAIASTGTILLVHRGAQGRRIATLLPDHHICIVRHSQIYETVPEALAALSPLEALPITSISGPSATSDIEMTRIRGVHGPRRLTVLLCA